MLVSGNTQRSLYFCGRNFIILCSVVLPELIICSYCTVVKNIKSQQKVKNLKIYGGNLAPGGGTVYRTSPLGDQSNISLITSTFSDRSQFIPRQR